MDCDEFIPFIRNNKVIKAARSSGSIDNTKFFVRYNSHKDLYESSSHQYCLEGWDKLTYYTECIDHHHERYHRMSYLKRHDECSPEIEGKVHWRFDISAISDWSRVEIFVGAKLWRKTSIDVDLIMKSCDYCGHKKSKKLEINKMFKLSLEDLEKKDLKYLDLIATLKGGDRRDDVPFQRPQLFRTHDNDSEWLFSFTIS